MGIVLLLAGIGVTVCSEEQVWYGALVIGVIEVARGVYYLMRSGSPPVPEP